MRANGAGPLLRVVTLGLLLMVAVALTASLALGDTAGDDSTGLTDPSPATLQRVAEICQNAKPCSVVAGAVDPRSDRSIPIGQTIAEHGVPANECPAARDAYADFGGSVDVFLGGCPTEADVRARFEDADPEALQALKARFNQSAREAPGPTR